MNRLGIFVEGHTELVFVEGLIREIAGQRDVRIQKQRIKGGRNVPREAREWEDDPPAPTAHFYVLIVN